jgi:MarR family transcriptional regulator, transcriptional regulator for hemolysin
MAKSQLKRANSVAEASPANASLDVESAKPFSDEDDPNWTTDSRFGFLIHDVSRLRRTLFDDYVRPLGITRAQWVILARLGRRDGATQSDLAAELETGKASLGQIVDRLEAAGLVVRHADPVDRRANRIYIAKKGLQLRKVMEEKSHEVSELVLEGISRAERDYLTERLRKIRRNILKALSARKVPVNSEAD